MESFDILGHDIEGFRKEMAPIVIGSGNNHDPLVLTGDGEQMKKATELMSDIKNGVPKGKLHDLVNEIRLGGQWDEAIVTGRVKEKESLVALKDIEKVFGKGPGKWLHILDLWDYVGGDI